MRHVAVLAVLAGCAAPRASTPAPVNEDEHAHGGEHVDPKPTSRMGSTAPQVLVSVARPDLPAFTNRMPDPERELRWPLSVSAHPGLEPSFAIGPALAQPTVAWTSLCTSGAQNRFGGGQLRDLTAYLRAWCAVERGDFDGGVEQLVKLSSTVVPKLADAVRLDIVSVLAANDADAAERMLAKHKLSNLERLDLLAAVFVELGKRADADAINSRALAADHGANHADSCRRFTRAVVLSSPDTRDQPLVELGDLATQDKPDPQCVALYPEVACWVSLNREHISSVMGLRAIRAKQPQLADEVRALERERERLLVGVRP